MVHFDGSNCMALSIEHPVTLVNGTKGPLRSVFRPSQHQGQALTEFRMEYLKSV